MQALDNSEPIESGTKDEIASLSDATNAMVGSLRRIVSHMHESAGRIAASSVSLNDMSDELKAVSGEFKL